MAELPSLPPTSQLPSIQQIASYPVEDLLHAVKYLKVVYNPEVRGSRRHRPTGDFISPRLHAQFLDDLRSDGFERSYAIRWLTALISQVGSCNTEETESGFLLDREILIQEAASLLSTCSGTSAAGVIVRDFAFTADDIVGSRTLKVHLKDIPLDNGDYSSVGAQTWGGACVLAETIVKGPKRFGLLHTDMQKHLRILELGAGTGLVSLTIARLLEHAPLPEVSSVDIIATDYYPSVLANLQSNVQSNFPMAPEKADSVIQISTHGLDWSLFAETCIPSPPFHQPFDLVLGADIVYEAQHASWIKCCLEKLLRKPTPDDGDYTPQFHLVIPLRATHMVESDTVEKTFTSIRVPGRIDSEALELGIMSKETIICDAGSGLGTDQVEYAYYVIGWMCRST